MKINYIYNDSCLNILPQIPDNSIDCIVTSPPYWGLRDYGAENQIGLEPTLEEYIQKMLQVTQELYRILKPSGTMFWNHGDCYGGSSMTGGESKKEIPQRRFPNAPHRKAKPKSLTMQNYQLIWHMTHNQGWYLRNIIIWYKPNAMPEPTQDRLSNKYEPIFFLTKSTKYFFNLNPIRKPIDKNTLSQFNLSKSNLFDQQNQHNPQLILGKNPGDVWNIPTQPFPDAHFATFPINLIKPLIAAGSPEKICSQCQKPIQYTIKADYFIHQVKPFPKDITPEGKKAHNYASMKFAKASALYKPIKTKCNCNKPFTKSIILDPFMGTGTTALAALQLNRNFIGIEINPKYINMAYKRIKHLLNQTNLIDLL